MWQVLLALCFLFSGATSLVLEIVWAKKLSYILGNSLYGSSTVVASFMAGLALGAYLSRLHRFRRSSPIRLYAHLQILIAIGGFLSIPLLDIFEPVFAWIYQEFSQTHSLFLFIRFCAVFVLLMAPVTLMGMTLPVVVEAIDTGRTGTARFGGLLYGINTLGAFAGTMTAGYLLIPAFGLRGTTQLAALTDIGIALVLLYLNQNQSRQSASKFQTNIPKPSRSRRFRITPMDAVILISGMTAISLEVVWFRYLVNIFGATTYALTNMMGAYLVSVALGSIFGVGLLRRNTNRLTLLIVMQLGICFVTLFGVFIYNLVPDLYIQAYWWLGGNARFANLIIVQFAAALAVVLPPTLIFGAMFPVFLAWSPDKEKAVSRVYVCNTIGGIAGSLLTGFFILPSLGLDQSLRLLVTANMLLALVLIFMMPSLWSKRILAQVTVVIAFIGASIAAPHIDTLGLSRGIFMLLGTEQGYEAISNHEGRRILYQEEGVNGTVAVIANEYKEGGLSLRVSGKPVAVTNEDSRRHLLMLGHLPMMFAKTREDVAVIGYGTGSTTGSVLKYPDLGRVDVLELENRVLEADHYFSLKTGRPLDDKRTRVYPEDGRTFLTYTDRKYDVITSDPISPWIAGASSLYSSDFYMRIVERLKPNGIFCQWLQMGDMSPETYQGVIATVDASFKNVAIFVHGTDSVILASQQPLTLPWEKLVDFFEVPSISEELASNSINQPVELLNLFMTGPDQVTRYSSSAKNQNNDNNVWLEYQMAKEVESPLGPEVLDVTMKSLAGNRMNEILKTFPGLPVESVAEHLVKFPPLQASIVHPLIYRDIQSAVPMDLPFEAWFQKRLTLERKQFTFARQWQAARRALRSNSLQRARSIYEKLLSDVLLPSYYQIGLEYIYTCRKMGDDDKALAFSQRLQSMSPALPDAYKEEITISGATGVSLDRIVQRARLFIPDFKP
ncbi:MAG: hypothetical protein CL917_08550 [Deltaproteobacteria bacterium]|nr:hypothetical protein [Deltaproteobacteria bacterium]